MTSQDTHPWADGKHTVIKRNGEKQPVRFDKIHSHIQRNGHQLKNIETSHIASRVISDLTPVIQSWEIGTMAARHAFHCVMQHPEYGILASRLHVAGMHKRTTKQFSKLVEDLHAHINPTTKKHAPIVSDRFLQFVREHASRLDSAIIYNRDSNIPYMGLLTLEKGYLLKMNDNVVERPQHMYMRVAIQVSSYDIEKAIETYEALSKGLYTHASPTLFNSGTRKNTLASCYLMTFTNNDDPNGDSIEDIFGGLKNAAIVSKSAGGIGFHMNSIRASGSYIEGTNGTVNGLIPMLRVYNHAMRYVDQGGNKRPGALSIYIEPWHADVMEVINLRRNEGHADDRARELFSAMWIPDLFMKRVEKNEDWTLMCPKACPGLSDVYGDEFEELYERYEREGRGITTMKAHDLFQAMCEAKEASGVPYLLFKDSANRKSNQKNLGTIKSSNLCVSGNTRILTDKGNVNIKSQVDKKVNVWNGEEWSEVTVKETAKDVELVRVTTSSGMVLECTPEHKFILEDGETRVDAADLTLGTKLVYTPPIKYDGFASDSMQEATAFRRGFIYACAIQKLKGRMLDRHDHQEVKVEVLHPQKDQISDEALKWLLYDEKLARQMWPKENHKMLAFCVVPKNDQKISCPLNAPIETRKQWCAGFVAAFGGVHQIPVGRSGRGIMEDPWMMFRSIGMTCRLSQYDYHGRWHLTFTKKDEEEPIPEVIGIERVTGKHDTYCFTEPKRHAGTFNGQITGQCTEIIQYSDPENISVCNLASIALPKFVKEDGTFDHQALHKVTKLVTRNLNNVIDESMYPLEEMKKSNLRDRPMGIGVQGLADVFVKCRLPWSSEGAKQLNLDIFETIYHAAVETSVELAELVGPYDSFEGSPASQGLLQFDLWGEEPGTRYDWAALKERVKTSGMRNSLLLAPMPTASTAQILGNSEGIDPLTSNIYVRRVLSGEFQVINTQLIYDLIELGLWNESMNKKLLQEYGSIQNIPEIPKHIKEIYKTVWEVSVKTMIDLSADRGRYICQSQSLNLFMTRSETSSPISTRLFKSMFYAWKKGLKTGVYYLRTTAALKPVQFTVDPTKNKDEQQQQNDQEQGKRHELSEEDKAARLACSLENKDACVMCSS